jgi:GTPase SAR1 family protein
MLKKDKPKLVNGIAEEDDDAMQGKIYKIVVIGAGGVG